MDNSMDFSSKIFDFPNPNQTQMCSVDLPKEEKSTSQWCIRKKSPRKKNKKSPETTDIVLNPR